MYSCLAEEADDRPELIRLLLATTLGKCAGAFCAKEFLENRPITMKRTEIYRPEITTQMNGAYSE